MLVEWLEAIWGGFVVYLVIGGFTLVCAGSGGVPPAYLMIMIDFYCFIGFGLFCIGLAGSIWVLIFSIVFWVTRDTKKEGVSYLIPANIENSP